MKKIGNWWLPDSDTHFEPYIQRDGGYQIKERDHALSFCKRFRCAVDIGAHVGFWTRDLAKKFEVVYAFEPVLEFSDCLSANLVPDLFQNCQIINAALGTRNTAVTLHKGEENTGHTRVSSMETSSFIDFSQIVEMRCLDNLTPAWSIDFIKIDVEGHEFEVLLGSIKTLIAYRPVVNLEIKFEPNPGCIDRLFRALGANKLGQYKNEHVYGWA